MNRSLQATLRRRAAGPGDAELGPPLGRKRLQALRQNLYDDVLRPLPPDPPTRERVVVIGAGFAGLAAAYFLRVLGYRVSVFEAAGRVGGRVWTVQGPGTPPRPVEWGAELIGYNHALWMGFGELFNLGFSLVTGDDTFDQLGLAMPMWLDGTLIPDAADIWDGMDKAFATLDAESLAVPDPYQPWNAQNAQQLDATPLSSWKQKLHLSPLVDAAVEVDFACNNTLPTANQSYLAVLAQVSGGGGSAYWTDTEVVRCESGNQSLATSLAEALTRSGVTVQTASPVQGVTRTASGVTVNLKTGGPVDADFVVLAVPPTAWPAITFTPALGSDVVMTTGPAVKFISACSDRFWLGSRRAPNALSDVIGETWEASDNQAWTPGQNVVLSVFAGAKQAADALKQPDVAAWYATSLERLYPGYGSRLRAKPEFVAWPNDALIGCGYSCPAPGKVTTVARTLSKPYAPFNSRLVFAGEHACPAFFGYMEGALESGLLAMGQIAEMTQVFPVGNVVGALKAAADAGRAPA